MSGSTDSAERRSARQELIKNWNQDRLAKSKVLVVGLGALGNEVAKNLALLGVGSLTLLDMDDVEQTNLNRTVLFDSGDLGKKKAKVAATKLRTLSRETKIEHREETIQDYIARSPERFGSHDVIAGCLDNMEARFVTNQMCVWERIPYVDGGTVGFGGSVQVVLSPFTPCLECNVPRGVYSTIGIRFSCGPMENINLTDETRRIRIPAIITTTSIISAIQVQEIVKILIGLPEFLRGSEWPLEEPIENVVQYDGRTCRLVETKLHKNEDCYVCGAKDPIGSSAHFAFRHESISADAELTLGELSTRVAGRLGWNSANITPSIVLPYIRARKDILSKLIVKLSMMQKRIISRSPEDSVGVTVLSGDEFRLFTIVKAILEECTKLAEGPQNRRRLENMSALIYSVRNLNQSSRLNSSGLTTFISDSLSLIRELEKTESGGSPLAEWGLAAPFTCYALNPELLSLKNVVEILMTPK